MRYVPGGDVRAVLRREGLLPPDRAVAIISPVASALDAAHGAGLVHRDVKPANMLLDARAGRPDHVYLSDFGLSKAWQGSTGLTGSGLFLGTVDYSAPEQIEGLAVDGRADQYALGCAAFELLAGEPPFRREQGLAVVYAQLSAPPPLLARRLPGLDPVVDEVLARGLAKAPGDRYGSCGEFAHALRLALGLAAYGPGNQNLHQPGRVATEIASHHLAVRGSSASAARVSHAAGRLEATQGPGRPPYQERQPGVPVTGPPQAAAAGGGLPPKKARVRVLVATGATAVLLIALGVALLTVLRRPPAPHAGPAHNVPASRKASPVALPLAQFKVCAFPAVTCTVNGVAAMKTEPARIFTSADGSGYLKNLTWSGWGSATAQGTGTLEVDDCSPDCADGTFTGYPATATLSGLTPYGSDKQAYADMVVSAPTAPFPPQAFRKGLVP
jgi:serine/threonine-protein kinase